MEAAIVQGDFDVQQREASQGAFFHAGTKSLFDRRPEFSWHVTTCDLGLELHPLPTTGSWCSHLANCPDPPVCFLWVVSSTTWECFVSHLRLTHININTVGALQDVDFDIVKRPCPS